MAIITQLTLGRLRFYLFIITIASIFAAGAPVYAQSKLILNDQITAVSLQPYLTVYQDTSSKLTIEDVSKDEFSHNFKDLENYSLGFSNASYWLTFELNNQSKATEWFLKSNFNSLQYLDVYEVTNDQTINRFYSGIARPIENWDYQSYRMVFPLTPQTGQTQRYFVRIQSKTPLIVNFELNQYSELVDSESISNVMSGSFIGMMLILFLVNLLFYFILKIKSQFFLSIYILGMISVYGICDGLLLPYFKPEIAIYSALFHLMSGSVAFLGLYMYYEQLILSDKSEKFVQIVRYTVSSYWLAVIFLAAFIELILPYQMYLAGLLAFPLIGFAYSGYAWLNRLYHARFVFIGFACLSISYFIQLRHQLGYSDPLSIFMRDTGRLGILALTALLSIAVLDYIRRLKERQQSSQKQAKLAEDKFKQVFEQAYQMLFMVSAEGKVLSVNNEVERFLNKTQKDIVDTSFIDVFSSLRGVFDQDISRKNIQTALNGTLTTQTVVAYATDGTLRDLEISFQPVRKDGNRVDNIIVQVRDITKQTHAFKAIQDMVVGIVGLSTENFFKNFLIEISRIYNAKYVLLSQLNDTFPQTATSIAIIKNKKLIPNITYAVKNSPSELLLDEHLCNYPKQVNQLFPNDEWLNKYSIESYLGVNIKDTEGNIIGFLSVMDDKPMHEDNYFIEVLDVFAARIANELRQQESQDALKKALEKLDFHISNTPLGVIEWDNKFNVTKWNKAAEKIFGFTLEHFHNKNPIDILVPRDQVADIQQISHDLMNNKGGQYSLNKNLTLDGRVILCEWYNTPLVNSQGKVTGVASLVNDVTAEHEALNALYIKEQEQREIFNALMDAVFLVDQHGCIVSANNAANSLFNYSIDELIGRNVSLLMPPKEAKEHDKYIEQFLATGISEIIGVGRDLFGRKKGGEIFPIHLSIATLPTDKSGEKRLIATCHDLTEFKQQQETLRQTQKMDALGNLTGGIAHDFNNLLGIINGYSELLTANVEPDSKLLTYAKHIQKASSRGAKLTKKLLSFASKSTIETEQVNINNVLMDEFEMLQKTITPRINLTYSLEDDLPLTSIDKAELEDSVLNLTINAMHAIEKNGEIIITTELVEIDTQRSSLHNIPAGQYIHLSIQDNGSGMDKDTKQKALEPFFTTKGQAGTGLGLSQVYGFVERSKGSIDIQSTLGKGTTISLCLPVVEQPKEKVEAKTKPLQVSAQSANILVVDDEPSLVELSTTILTRAGYHVISAGSAKEALKLLASNPVDAMLCDIIMPNMDGAELAKIVQKEYPEIVILFVSGYYENDPQHEDAILRKNTLMKPYRSEELLRRMSQLLNDKVNKEVV